MMLSMRGAGLPVVMMADADMHADVFIKLTTVLFVSACLVPKPRLLSVILCFIARSRKGVPDICVRDACPETGDRPSPAPYGPCPVVQYQSAVLCSNP